MPNNISIEHMYSNKIHVKIFNTFVKALIDTGCSTSVLSEKLIQQLRVMPQQLEVGNPKFLIGANGSKIPIIGKSSLSIKIGGFSVPFEFLVAKFLTHDLLLGNDFLQETKALINYSDNSITF